MHRFHLYCCPSSAPYSQTAAGKPRLNSTTPSLQYSTETRGDATVPFMHQRCEDVSYLCDETFGWERVDILFDDGSELRIVLPAPGILETLVHDLIALRRAFSTELAVTIPQADKQELTDMDRLKAKLAARKNPTSMPIYANTVTATVALPRFEIDSTINGRTLAFCVHWASQTHSIPRMQISPVYAKGRSPSAVSCRARTSKSTSMGREPPCTQELASPVRYHNGALRSPSPWTVHSCTHS